MIVVDASVLVNAFTDDGPAGASARAELARDPHWVAPEHLVVGAFSAVRGRWLGRSISDRRARDSLAALAAAAIELLATAPLVDRMWELRRNVTGYDSAYLAVAEVLQCPLVTADIRLGRAPGRRCEIRLALPVV